MNVLVTGAAGYIGSVLCPALLSAGHKVTALDNFRYGPQQATALAACCADPNFALHRGDMRSPRTINDFIRDADAVVHLAAIVGAPACESSLDEAALVNRYSVEHVAAVLSPGQLLIYPNTNSGYGRMPEGADAPLCEDSPLDPQSLYAILKQDGERAALEHPNAVIFRLATVFGASPRMRTDLLVNDLVLRAVRDRSLTLFEPEARRNYVHARDVADAFIWAIDRGVDSFENWFGKHRVFNLGHDGSNCTKRALCELIRHQVPGFEYHVGVGSDPDRRDYVVSNERMRRAGFEARRSLEDGIAELVKLYRAFPETPWGNV